MLTESFIDQIPYKQIVYSDRILFGKLQFLTTFIGVPKQECG